MSIASSYCMTAVIDVCYAGVVSGSSKRSPKPPPLPCSANRDILPQCSPKPCIIYRTPSVAIRCFVMRCKCRWVGVVVVVVEK